jgi:hypothetical protein
MMENMAATRSCNNGAKNLCNQSYSLYPNFMLRSLPNFSGKYLRVIKPFTIQQRKIKNQNKESNKIEHEGP